MAMKLAELDRESRAKVKALERRKAQGRSAVSNGTVSLPEIDGRARIARRFKDIAGQIIVDQGGEGRVAEVRGQLIRRFAAVSVLAEEMEAEMARGEQISVERHSLLVSSLVRVAARIGIDRRLKEVLPSLAQYLEGKQEEDEG